MDFIANEFRMEVPDEFKDKSVNIFALTDDGPSESSIVVTRNILKEGQDAGTYAADQITQLSSQLPKFHLAEQRNMQIGGREPAIFLDFQWQSNSAILHQYQVMFAPRQRTSPDGFVLTFTLTCKGRITPEWSRRFDQMLRTLKLRSHQS